MNAARRGARTTAPKKAQRATPRSAPRAGAINHKTPEAQKARDELDLKVVKLLAQKKNAEGLGKVVIAQQLGSDANAVKASLNRLDRDGIVTTSGTTMNTVYKAVPNAEALLREKRETKGARASSRRPSSRPAASA